MSSARFPRPQELGSSSLRCERFQAKVSKRKLSSKTIQAEVSKRKLSSESSQAKVPKLFFRPPTLSKANHPKCVDDSSLAVQHACSYTVQLGGSLGISMDILSISRFWGGNVTRQMNLSFAKRFRKQICMCRHHHLPKNRAAPLFAKSH